MNYEKLLHTVGALALTVCLGGAVASAHSSQGISAGGAHVYGFTFDEGYISALSDNGRWALFKNSDYNEEDAVPRRMDLERGIIEELPVGSAQGGGNIAVCRDITDDGNMIVGSYNRRPAYWRDGEWHLLPMPDDTRGFLGDCYSVSTDGHRIVGWVSKSFTQFRPVIWEDGELVELGALPDYDEMLQRHIIDRIDYQEHKEKGQTPNLAFFKISGDGRKVLSGVDHNYPAWGCSYIVYDIDERTYQWVSRDPSQMKGFVDGAAMSDNGEWVSAAEIFSMTNPDGSWDDHADTFLYHVPDGTVEFGKGGSPIDDMGRSYAGGVSCDGHSVPIPKILKQKYGIDFYEATGFDGTGWVFDVSRDGTTLIGMPSARLYVWSARLPEPFVEAARGVNLLTDWSCTPAPGSSLCRLDRVEFSCGYAGGIDSTKKIVVLRDGEPVAESLSVDRKGKIYVADFGGMTLDDGAVYTVKVPEGMFYLDGTDSLSEAISVSYTGRMEKPLEPVSVSPREGASLMELGSYSMIALTYPADVSATETAEAYLFEKDARDPLCRLSVGTSGNVAYLYPAATRRLSKGREYVVRVMEGALTDLQGYCPSIPLELSYRGAYVPKVEEGDGDYLFYDGFESPNESLGNFLQYEGDHLTPVSTMQEWGFDADNTPWNFSVRDDTDYDYCAASTSAYVEQGRADDWLVIPQLTISNAYDWLTFRSQSYRYDRKDRLKVIVWRSDEVLGSLDASTVERMRSEGTVVYDELQHPGSQQDVLAGDWRMNEISLAQFEGSKVYIAFVNENEGGSALFVDDIAVVYRGNYTLRSTVPTHIVGAGSVPVGGVVKVLGDMTYDTLEARYETADGLSSGELKVSGLSLGRDDEYEFLIPKECPLNVGECNAITLTVTLGSETRTMELEVKDMLYEAPHRVLLEEGTGSWCGYCPLGFLAMDYIEATYGDMVTEVSVHNDDPFALASYDQFLQLGGYPMGRVNRGPVVAPAVLAPETGVYSFSSASGEETFVDMIERALSVPAEGEVEISRALVGDGIVTVDTEVRFALDRADCDYNLLAVVTEDRLPYYQSNYLSGMSDPLLGEWGKGDPQMYYEYPAVARGVAGTGFYGEGGLLPTEFKAGEKASARLRFALPQSVKNVENVRIAVVLIDGANGDVVSCAKSEYLDPMEVRQVNSSCRFSVEGGRVLFDGNSDDVEVFTPQGVRVANGSLQGLYIVRAVGIDGVPISARMMVR